MRIQVTKRDIDFGFANDTAACPVALALKRRFKTNLVSVGFARAMINTNGYPLPESVSQFIREFDARKSVQPFQFTLATVKRTILK